MRGVFFGTSAFAVPALRAFAVHVECVLVVTQPDRPAGRGHRLQPTPVKEEARALGLATIEPTRLSDALPVLASAEADLFAVASYGKILAQRVLDLPTKGALNVHPSLLPLYRGATPLQSQLRDGVRTGGVTIIFMDAGMDTGDIVLARTEPIGERETYGELHDRFAALGAEMLGEACDLVASDRAVRTPQANLGDPAEIARTLTKPLDRDALRIDWSWSAQRIVDLVRSLAPSPGARALLPGRDSLSAVRDSLSAVRDSLSPGTGESESVKILEARVVETPDAADLIVPCGAGEFVAVERLVPPNRGAMSGRAYKAARA